MKLKLIFVLVLLLAIAAAALYLRYGGVTHRQICETVKDESGAIQDHIDERYQALDKKLDRIEGKLDRLLEIANCPLPDNLQPVH